MIIALYAAVLAALYIALSARIIAYRRAHQIGLGDHGDTSLLKRMRAQANFAEYVPFALVLMLIVELQASPAWLVHVIGLTLLIGRIAHAYGFSASPPVMKLRVAGTMLTLVSFVVSIASLLVLAIL